MKSNRRIMNLLYGNEPPVSNATANDPHANLSNTRNRLQQLRQQRGLPQQPIVAPPPIEPAKEPANFTYYQTYELMDGHSFEASSNDAIALAYAITLLEEAQHIYVINEELPGERVNVYNNVNQCTLAKNHTHRFHVPVIAIDAIVFEPGDDAEQFINDAKKQIELFDNLCNPNPRLTSTLNENKAASDNSSTFLLLTLVTTLLIATAIWCARRRQQRQDYELIPTSSTHRQDDEHIPTSPTRRGI